MLLAVGVRELAGFAHVHAHGHAHGARAMRLTFCVAARPLVRSICLYLRRSLRWACAQAGSTGCWGCQSSRRNLGGRPRSRSRSTAASRGRPLLAAIIHTHAQPQSQHCKRCESGISKRRTGVESGHIKLVHGPCRVGGSYVNQRLAIVGGQDCEALAWLAIASPDGDITALYILCVKGPVMI